MNSETNKVLNFSIEKDRIVVSRNSSAFFPDSKYLNIIEEVLLPTDYENLIIQKISNHFSKETMASLNLFENMINYDLSGFSIYLRILGFKESIKTPKNFYEYYDGSKLTVEISGPLIESGELDYYSAVVLINEVFDLYGVIDYIGFGTWIKFLHDYSPTNSEESGFKAILTSTVGQKDIISNTNYLKMFDTNDGAELSLQLEKSTVLYGTLAKNFKIVSLKGILILDTRELVTSNEIDIERYFLLDNLMLNLGIKQYYSNIKIAPPKISIVEEFKFKKYIGEKAKLKKNIEEPLAPNDILAEIEEFNTNEIYDLTEIVHFEDPNDIVKYLHVLNGELVTPGTLIFSKPNLSGFSNTELTAQSTGIIDLSSLLSTGEIKVLGGKSIRKIECGMRGVLAGVTQDGYVIITDEGYSFDPRFVNFINAVPISSPIAYIRSLEELPNLVAKSEQWVILDIKDFENLSTYIDILIEKNVEGIISYQIPLKYYFLFEKRGIKLILVNGFGSENAHLRYDIAFNKSSWVAIYNNNVVLGT